MSVSLGATSSIRTGTFRNGLYFPVLKLQAVPGDTFNLEIGDRLKVAFFKWYKYTTFCVFCHRKLGDPILLAEGFVLE
jgi:hypothetical protein